MNNNDINKFNKYCFEVMGYDENTFQDRPELVYDPYNNLFQLAAVVEELINLTSKHPTPGFTNVSTWRVWSNYVIDAMVAEGLTNDSLEAKMRLELDTYEDGMVSKTQFIEQIIKVCGAVEKVESTAKRMPTIEEKCKAILKDIGYSFAVSSYPDNNMASDLLEEKNVNPFYYGDDETLELWAWRQTAALENYFEQRPKLWELLHSYPEPYVYDVGPSIHEWRQDRLIWCIDKLEDII